MVDPKRSENSGCASSGNEAVQDVLMELDLSRPIVERFVDESKQMPTTTKVLQERGFPAVKRLIPSDESKPATKTKVSLYARSRMLKSAQSADEAAEHQQCSKKPCDSSVSPTENKATMSGNFEEKEKQKISQENDEIIRKMSQKDIEEALEMIKSKLSPETLNFLRSSSKKSASPTVEKKVAPGDDIEDKIPVSIDEIASGKYPKLSVEPQKLEWLGDIPSKEKTPTDIDELQARFDFNGVVINEEESEQIDVKLGLHHHGDQPGRAGYTVNELLTYVHSKFSAQKQLALKTFAAIITNAYRGAYDDVFNHNLIEYLLKDSSLVLTVRLALDDTSETIWKHALQCFRAFVCNTFEDEIFVDRGFLLFEDFMNFGFNIKLLLKPVLDDEVHIDDTVQDQRFVMYDVIDCLVQRTNILSRFAYFLNTLLVHDANDEIYVDIVLDVLIRFARHSRKIAETILDCQELMGVILEKYSLKPDCSASALKSVHIKSFKLIRILVTTIVADCCQNKPGGGSCSASGSRGCSEDFSLILHSFLNQLRRGSFVRSLEYCLHLSPDDARDNASVLLKIVVEGVRTWIKFLSVWPLQPKHAFFTDLKSRFSLPAFVRLFGYCTTLQPKEADGNFNRAFDFQFASCVFVLARFYFDIFRTTPEAHQIGEVIFPLLRDICNRWLKAIDNDNITPDFDSGMAILALEEFILDTVPIESSRIDQLAASLWRNEIFVRKMFDFLKNSSNAANFSKEVVGSQRDSDNLPSFGSIYFRKFKSISLFNEDSSICMLLALLRIEDRSPDVLCAAKNVRTIRHLVDYIRLVGRNIQANMEPSVFDLIEIHVVSRACLAARNYFHANLAELSAQDAKTLIKYATLVNVLNVSEIKALLIVSILFDAKIWSGLGHSFTEANFAHFKQVYAKLSPFSDEFWLFHPLLSMIDFKVEPEAKKTVVDIEELVACLKYIQLFFVCVPEYFEKMQVKTGHFFILLCSVFFFPDLAFFDSRVDAVMKEILAILLNTKGGIVLKAGDSVPYVGFVIDFFERFLSEFEFSSVGNALFCNYVLVFLQRNCSIEFKLKMFSDHSTDIELANIMSISLDQLLVPMDNFLLPIETDLSLIDTYFRMILCPSVTPISSPVLYCVIVHHIHHTLYRQDSKFVSELDDVQKKRFEYLLRSAVRLPERAQAHLKSYLAYDASKPYGLALVGDT